MKHLLFVLFVFCCFLVACDSNDEVNTVVDEEKNAYAIAIEVRDAFEAEFAQVAFSGDSIDVKSMYYAYSGFDRRKGWAEGLMRNLREDIRNDELTIQGFRNAGPVGDETAYFNALKDLEKTRKEHAADYVKAEMDRVENIAKRDSSLQVLLPHASDLDELNAVFYENMGKNIFLSDSDYDVTQENINTLENAYNAARKETYPKKFSYACKQYLGFAYFTFKRYEAARTVRFYSESDDADMDTIAFYREQNEQFKMFAVEYMERYNDYAREILRLQYIHK